MSFSLPPEVLGFLEWSSGVLRINASPRELELLKTHVAERRAFDFTRPDDRRTATLLRVLTHEQFHFLQVLTTGYAYTLACVAFQLIMQHVSRLAGMDESSLLSLLEQTLPEEPTVARKFAELDEPGPYDLTIRDVIESAAHLYECKSLMPGLDHEMYLSYLASSNLPVEYRRAYDLATRILGPTAFENFLPAAQMALLFRWPHEAFPDALHYLRQLAHLDAVYRRPEDLPGLHSILPALRQRNRPYLGVAADVAAGKWEAGAALTHPFYTKALDGLRTEDLLLLTVDPRAMSPALAPMLAQPVLFNDHVIQLPAGFERRDPRPILPPGTRLSTEIPDARELVNVWILLAGLCHRVLQSTGHGMRYRVPAAHT